MDIMKKVIAIAAIVYGVFFFLSYFFMKNISRTMDLVLKVILVLALILLVVTALI